MANEFDTQQTNTYTLPVVALRGSVVFPRTEGILTFGRPKTKAAVQAAYSGDRLLAIFTQKDARISDPTPDDLYEVGTLVEVQQVMPADEEIHVLVVGKARIGISEVVAQNPFAVYKVHVFEENLITTAEEEARFRHLVNLFEKAIRLGKPADVQTVMRLLSSKIEAAELVDQIAYLLDIKTPQKQDILETLDLSNRLKKVEDLLGREVGILELERTISSKTQKRFEEQMKKAMLKEHQKTIQQELRGLGENDGGDEDVDELRRKIKEAGMPRDVRKKAEKELKRLIQMSPNHPESGYVRNYLDWLIEMPWSIKSPNDISLKQAAAILDEDHYALKKTKERILEFLAVMKLKGESQKRQNVSSGDEAETENETMEGTPTILCFIGPPGVGKTSIGRSIARALGRKFVRISLGGIRDEAEIRGHRRTYVGALPGRIIQGIKNAGTKNPVFMLDEIDKLGNDFRGDPSSALLEVLDPEQNREFSDHYLEVPFDLSEVMFICTGNILDTIPPALRDRMEIIRFVGYTEDEKYNIAKGYLWPKQLKNHGLSEGIQISSSALREIISRYTREAGVRSLERNLATVARKLARGIAEGKKAIRQIAKEDLRKLLGPAQFTSLLAEKKDEVGISTGLAVTPVGGEIIFVETALMPGKGKLTLTGQLGEVMRESAMAAFSYARSHSSALGISNQISKATDVHIHVPEGAVPKDGPSAGVAMATSLISALTGTKTKRDVAMTGEITLRGRVMEIGGVKDKVIAAHRAGIKTIVLPQDNQKDMDDVPDKVKKDIKFVFASHLDQVLEVAIPDFNRRLRRLPVVAPSTFVAS
ncbi:MAG: endopeptidase La [Candidatus Blackburnbacteria bacterium RIFCSPHIGHO2_01_FULL_43_15b]|uniref:Lon protease n=1 Tax=Candidatus Blackburnbacteria bacterium RIFCSPHIGHO2_01_FULL_43_15b TaxID=1797513 RepID=A0A1G1V125_9BACT|nr:MAG: endopeptidase La [Candidatus Blackburnbacteria bacterium RIFCSPHIGHO2_01_FULL_43_15b]